MSMGRERDLRDAEVCDDLFERRDTLDKANTNLSRQQKVIETLVGLNYNVRSKRGVDNGTH